MDERIELLERGFATFNARDTEAWLANCHPEIRIGALRYELEQTAYEGHDGGREFMADIDATWEVVRFEPSEYREVGERMLVTGRLHARGRGSGVEMDAQVGILFTFRDGLIHRYRTYTDAAAAEAAAADPAPFI